MGTRFRARMYSTYLPTVRSNQGTEYCCALIAGIGPLRPYQTYQLTGCEEILNMGYNTLSRKRYQEGKISCMQHRPSALAFPTVCGLRRCNRTLSPRRGAGYSAADLTPPSYVPTSADQRYRVAAVSPIPPPLVALRSVRSRRSD